MTNAQPPAGESVPAESAPQGDDTAASTPPSRRQGRKAARGTGPRRREMRSETSVPSVPQAPGTIEAFPAEAMARRARRTRAELHPEGAPPVRYPAPGAAAAGEAPGPAAAAPGGGAAGEAPEENPVAAPTIGAPEVTTPGPIESPQVTAAGPVKRTSKAGRNLPAAISVGIGLMALVLGSLVFYPVAFVIVVTGFACIGVWEVSRALLHRDISVPLTPVMVGTAAMPVAAYFSGPEGLLFALVASAAAVLLWRSLDPAEGAVGSIFAGVFLLAWIPFFISFAILVLRGREDPTTALTLDVAHVSVGVLEVAILLLLVVANDTFGYLVGALFGKHPMAPKISPKKSWEGFAGSIGGAAVVAILATTFLIGQPWWVGLALAVGMVAAATAGDLAESMVKRELGVKDMSSILPGHGGVMDRLDSILFSAPMAFLIFTLLGRYPA